MERNKQVSTVVLGLGSNLGDCKKQLEQAIYLLSTIIDITATSSIMQSEALLLPASPKEWDRPFLNMAIRGTCPFPPKALLHAIKAIELAMGRNTSSKWAPRIIDIDILCMENLVFKSPDLHIPHPELLQRDFALVPLAEIYPDWLYPVPGQYFHKRADILTKILEEKIAA